MAIISNGFLISARKSAGGLNLYKRKGVQCLRNKPVRNPGYQASAAQAQQNTVFSLVTAFKASVAGMDALIRGGWGEAVKGKGRTSFNNWSSAVLSAITRSEDGRLLRGDARATSIAAFETNPGKVFRDRCPLTKSMYPNVGEGATAAIATGDGATGVVITIPEAVIVAWKQQLPTSYQNAADVSKDIVYVTSDALVDTITAPFFTATPASADGTITVTVPNAVVAAGDVLKVAYGAAPAPVGDFGQDADYAFGKITDLVVG